MQGLCPALRLWGLVWGLTRAQETFLLRQARRQRRAFAGPVWLSPGRATHTLQQ